MSYWSFFALVNGAIVGAVHHATGSWYDAALWGVIAALVMAPPKYDPAIMWKEWLENKRRDKLPECFGRVLLLHPHHRAENCCHECPHRGGCLELSKGLYPRHAEGNHFDGD